MTETSLETTAQNVAAILAGTRNVELAVDGFRHALRAMTLHLLRNGWPLINAIDHTAEFGDLIAAELRRDETWQRH